jgi:hypothetical protein
VSRLQAVILGMMLSWTPSLLFMAYLLWRAPLIESESRVGQLPLAFASANHTFRTITTTLSAQ